MNFAHAIIISAVIDIIVFAYYSVCEIKRKRVDDSHHERKIKIVSLGRES